MYNKLNELFPKTCVITTSKEEVDSIMDIFIKEKLEIKVHKQSFVKSGTTCWYFDSSSNMLQHSGKQYAIEQSYNIITPTQFINQYKQKTMKNFKNTVVVTGDVCLLKALLEKSIEIGWTLQDENIPTSILYFNSNEGDELKKNHVWWANSSDNIRYNLPNDWDKVIELLKEEEKYKIKIGDIVTCIKSETNRNSAGWEDGLTFKVTNLTEDILGEGSICWGGKDGCGVFESSLRLATPEEIKKYNKVIINGYECVLDENYIHFGCQSFNKEQIETIEKLTLSPINAQITIGNTTIDHNLILKLKNKFI